MAKIELHIPVEQYGFVAITLEDASADKTAEIYREYADAFKPQEGLTAVEFDSVVEKMCLGKTVVGGTDLWDKATPPQKWFINSLKRALKRIEAKNK